jgi:hypothetical protein
MGDYRKTVVTRGKGSVDFKKGIKKKSLLKERANPMGNHDRYWNTCIVKVSMTYSLRNKCLKRLRSVNI